LFKTPKFGLKLPVFSIKSVLIGIHLINIPLGGIQVTPFISWHSYIINCSLQWSL